MSDNTSMVNKVTGTVIRISVKLIILTLLGLLLFECVTIGYEFGHEIFYDSAISQGEGKEYGIIVDKTMDTSDVARKLKKAGLIKNEYSFVVQAKFYEYHINPGTYTLNTSMTPKEMLQLMNESQEDEE